MFSERSLDVLHSMNVSPEDYLHSLDKCYSAKQVLLFNLVIEFCSNWEGQGHLMDDFHIYMRKIAAGLQADTPLYNDLQDLATCILQFKEVSLFFLFKNRPITNVSPNVVLRASDIPESEINPIPEFLVIYRGMDRAEFESQIFQQSWTLDAAIARKFAFEHYENRTDRLVASCFISDESVLHYPSFEDEEREVITLDKSVKTAKIFESANEAALP